MQTTLTSVSTLNRSMLPSPAKRIAESGDGPVTLVESADLLQGQKAVGIMHNGSLYRLQATKLGKLILTK